MGLKILLAVPGHLKTVPMGGFCQEALVELGHEVRLFDFHSFVMERLRDRVFASGQGHVHMNRRFCQTVEAFKPDLLFAVFGMDLSAASLEYARTKGVLRACWWLNDPFQTQRFQSQATSYDIVFSNSSISIQDHRRAGTLQAYFLPVGIQPSVHRPCPIEARFACDVCFAGDWSPMREVFLSRLSELFNVKIFGPWKKKMRPDSRLHGCLVDGFFTPDQMASMFSSAKVVLNLHTWFATHDHGVNPRLLEAAGCGAFQLVDFKQEIPRLFVEGEEIFCFRNLEELIAMVHQALECDERRLVVGRAALNRALRDHTYLARMSEALMRMGLAQ